MDRQVIGAARGDCAAEGGEAPAEAVKEGRAWEKGVGGIEGEGALFLQVGSEAHVGQLSEVSDARARVGGRLTEVMCNERAEVVGHSQERGRNRQDVLLARRESPSA